MADIVMLYLVCVVVVAWRFGHIASLVTSALSVAALDFFFTEPYLSFAVADKRHLVTFAIMLFVGVFISDLTARVRRSAAQAREREIHTARLYRLSREIAGASAVADIANALRSQLEGLFDADVVLVLSDGEAGMRRFAADTAPGGAPEPETSTLARTLRMRSEDAAARGPASEGDESPASLRTPRGLLGIVSIRRRGAGLARLDVSAGRELVEAFAAQAALGLERVRLANEAQRTQIEIQKERLRNALLSSVSHDLRTPLAVVKGAVSALLDDRDTLATRRRQEYLETIFQETDRLDRLVRNLVNMTSLEAGALHARKEWQPLEEVVGVALNRLEEQLGVRQVRVAIAPEASLAPFDATLLEQVLVNLVENATRYTPSDSPISIRARAVGGDVEVEVADEGPGVPPGDEERIFEKFGRAATTTTTGMGLGLTICRGIVEVHGGRIWYENRRGGGASFRFRLPRDGEAPAMHPLPEVMAET